MDDVLNAAARLRDMAGSTLEALRLKTLWESVGKTYLVGSARFGLMTTPNLDLEVYVERPEPRAGFAVMAEIAAVPGIRRISYFDFMGSDDPGLYWWFEYAAPDGLVWDADIWLVPFSHPNAGMANDFAEAMNRVLTDDTRRAILHIKNAVRAPVLADNRALAPEEKMAGPYIRGIDIYKAVLRDRVMDPPSFMAWFRKNPPSPMETWHP